MSGRTRLGIFMHHPLQRLAHIDGTVLVQLGHLEGTRERGTAGDEGGGGAGDRQGAGGCR